MPNAERPAVWWSSCAALGSLLVLAAGCGGDKTSSPFANIGGGGTPNTGGAAAAAGTSNAGGTPGGAPSGGTPAVGGGNSGGSSGFGAGGTLARDSGADGGPTALVYVGSGSYGGGSGRISVYRLHVRTNELAFVGSADAGALDSFLAIDLPHRALYAADEATGNLYGFRLDATTFVPTQASTVGTSGHPVFVTTTRDGRYVLVSHYNEGAVEAFPATNGALGASLGPRYPGAQAHSIVLSPDERYAFAPCKGDDHVVGYTFNTQSGSLLSATLVLTESGDGPRHFAFHPGGAFAYLVNELSSTVQVYSYASSNGMLTRVQRVSTLPDGWSGQSAAAEVALTQSGDFLYASNRVTGATGLMAAYRVGPDGQLTLVEHQGTGGQTPRSFAVDPQGRFVVVGNQDSNSVAVLGVDAATGALGDPVVADIGVSPYFVGVVVPNR